MSRIGPVPLPEHALLQRYRRDGGYADCYATEIAGAVLFARYVEAFYTTWLFKTERAILRWVVSRPSSDAQAVEVARGARDAFAAWTVEERAPDQLLMRDFMGRTRSWFMCEPLGAGATRLYFGSAVVPRPEPGSGRSTLGFGFNALLGFHKLYSRALLGAARARLVRTGARPS